MTFEKVESGLELGDEVFTLEDPDTKEGAPASREYRVEQRPSLPNPPSQGPKGRFLGTIAIGAHRQKGENTRGSLR